MHTCVSSISKIETICAIVFATSACGRSTLFTTGIISMF